MYICNSNIFILMREWSVQEDRDTSTIYFSYSEGILQDVVVLQLYTFFLFLYLKFLVKARVPWNVPAYVPIFR